MYEESSADVQVPRYGGDVHFSSRVDTSKPNPIIVAQRKAMSQGMRIIKLNDSNPTVHGLAPQILSGPYAADPRGPLETRQLLAEFLRKRYRREASSNLAYRLYIVSSTSQAYAWLMMLLCDAGDAVLAPTPGYPLVESIARLQCVNTKYYPLRFDGSWTIDLAALEALLKDDTQRIRALVLINPNNPTGSYVKPEEREKILALAARYDVAIIADEVFYDYTLEPFEGNERFAGESSTLVFALDGFSKMLAAPHAKVGWIEVSGPERQVAEAMRRLDVIADDFLPMGATVCQHIPALLACADEQTQRVHERVLANLQTLHAMLEADPTCCISVLHPEGGWNVLLQVPSCLDDDDVALRLLQDYQRLSQPGYYFDMPNNGYLTLSLLPEHSVFVSNVQAIMTTIDAMLL